jgi:uncharacterized protein
VNKKRSGATTKLSNLTFDSQQCQRKQPLQNPHFVELENYFAGHLLSVPDCNFLKISVSSIFNKKLLPSIIPVMTFLYILLGLAVGVLSGIVGIGGGIMIVPLLVYFFHMSQHKAQGTSLAALLAPAGALAFWEYYKAGNVDLKAGLLIALGFLVGGYFGGLWAQHLSDLVLRRVFGTFLVIIGIRLLLSR